MDMHPHVQNMMRREIIRRPSEDARQYAYRIIKACILELLIAPGQKMSETDFASALNLSRTPIHDTFARLSREKLVDLIPQRGAYVSLIDFSRIEHAVWLHKTIGTNALHTIFIRNVKGDELKILYHYLRQIDDFLYQGNTNETPRLLVDYYHQLYVMAGNMDLIWKALQKSDLDLIRLLYLATSSAHVTEGFICELTNLTDALINRNTDQACLIYSNHMSRMLLLVPPLKAHNPSFFTPTPEKKMTKSLP